MCSGAPFAAILFSALGAQSVTSNLSGPDLGGLVLSPGVYHFDSSAQLTGTLTLDAQSNPGAIFVFQIETALTTASSAVVNVLNGDQGGGAFWQIGSSATLGGNTVFAGNNIADQSITLGSTATILCGGAIALNAGLTMNNNTISNDCTAFDDNTGRSDFGSAGFSAAGVSIAVPEPGLILLFVVALIGIIAIKPGRGSLWTGSSRPRSLGRFRLWRHERAPSRLILFPASLTGRYAQGENHESAQPTSDAGPAKGR